MLISIPYVFFLLPETKGVPLEKMDDLFATRPVYNANRIIMSQLQQESHHVTNPINTLGREGGKSSSGDVTPEKDSRGSLEINTATA